MNTRKWLPCVVLLWQGLAGGAVGAPPVDRQAIERAYADLGVAVAYKDMAAIRAHYAPGYVGTEPGGRRVNLDTEMRELARTLKPLRSVRMHHGIRQFDQSGDRAVVQTTLRVTGIVGASGQPFRVDGSMRDVWVRSGRTWLIASTHTQAMQAPQSGQPARPRQGSPTGSPADQRQAGLICAKASPSLVDRCERDVPDHQACAELDRYESALLNLCVSRGVAEACSCHELVLNGRTQLRYAKMRPQL